MQELLEWIKTGNNDKLAHKLNEDTSLANTKTEQGISLLQFAAYCRNADAISIIRKYKSDLDIFEAASLGESENVHELLKSSPDLLMAYSTDGFTTLGLSAFFGHIDLTAELLKAGADPNVAANNQFKVTPLHSACATSNVEMATLLIQTGADVNAKQMKGVTPLHSAAHNGQIDLVKLLVDNGADIQAQMDEGQTPLHMAEESGYQDTADLIKQLSNKQ